MAGGEGAGRRATPLPTVPAATLLRSASLSRYVTTQACWAIAATRLPLLAAVKEAFDAQALLRNLRLRTAGGTLAQMAATLPG